MPSSKTALLTALLASAAGAQPVAQGFAVERFYPSSAGGGWWVMDALEMGGGLGGALSLTGGYASDPYRVGTAPNALAVVSDQGLVDFAASASYGRWRLSLDLEAPIARGQSGTTGGLTYSAPSITPASNPDTLSDPRIGLEVRLLGDPGSVFRLGLGAQLFVPNGTRADYDGDETPRAMFRVLLAGDSGGNCWAAQLGVHVRPLDDPRTPGAPRGSEMLFGIAGGRAVPLTSAWRLVLGPELYGETAFGNQTTGAELLLGARAEGTGRGAQLRVKLGLGVGVDPRFGTPAARVLLGGEYFNRG